MAVATLTDAQKRALQDYIPALSNREPGIDLYTILSNIISLANANETGGSSSIISGTAEVADGDSTVTIASAGNDGKPAVATLAEADGSKYVLHAVWDGSDNLVITLSAAAAGANRTVSYIIDGR